MAKSDGTIYIDTKINTDGISSGLNSVVKDIKSESKSIGDLGQEVGESFSEGFETGVDNAPDPTEPIKKHTEDLQEKLNGISGSMTSFGSKATVALTAPLTLLGVKMAESAAEMNAMSSQFSQVFGNLEGNAAASLGKIADDTGIIEERLKGTYTSIAAFAKTTGLETSDALELSNRAMIAVADSAAFYDRSLEDTAESLRSFLKGNYENDAALGLSATEFTRNAAAMELYGVSFNELSEAQKQLTLLKMVEDANALSGALGQAARESDTWSNVTGNLNQEFTNLLGTLGQSLLPALTPVIQFITEMLNKFGELDPETQKMIVIIGAVVAALGPVASVVGSVISVVSALLPIITAIAGALNPITLAIGAVVAAIAVLIANWDAVKTKMEEFDAFLTDIFATDFTETFGSVLGEALNAFFQNVKNIWDSIKQIFGGIITFITGVFSGDWQKAWEGIKEIFSGVWNLLGSIIKTPINNIIGTINGLIGGVVAGINLIIRALNKLEFTVPEWIPGIGGKSVDFNIQEMTPPKIPYLATGAVIPPNAPFLAMLGDQKHGTNIEAPLDTIKQAVRDVVGAGNENAVIHAHLYLDGKEIFDAIIEQGRTQQAATGQNKFATL